MTSFERKILELIFDNPGINLGSIGHAFPLERMPAIYSHIHGFRNQGLIDQQFVHGHIRYNLTWLGKTALLGALGQPGNASEGHLLPPETLAEGGASSGAVEAPPIQYNGDTFCKLDQMVNIFMGAIAATVPEDDEQPEDDERSHSEHVEFERFRDLGIRGGKA